MDFELSDDEPEDLHIGSENIKLEITGKIKKGHGYKDHETIINTNHHCKPKKKVFRRSTKSVNKSCN
jgi:hypothetical protein